MKSYYKIVTGAAIAFLTASTSLAAPPHSGFAAGALNRAQSVGAPVILAQAEAPSPEEQLRKQRRQEGKQREGARERGSQEAPAAQREQRRNERQAAERAAENQGAEQRRQERRPREAAQQQESQATEREQRRKERQAAERAAENQAAEQRRQERRAREAAQQQESQAAQREQRRKERQAAERAAENQAAEQRRQERRAREAAEQQESQAAQREQRRNERQAAERAAESQAAEQRRQERKAREAAQQQESQAAEREQRRKERQAAERAAENQAAEQRRQERRAREAAEQESQAAEREQRRDERQLRERREAERRSVKPRGGAGAEGQAGLPPDAAPVLDSAKQPPSDGDRRRQQREARAAREQAGPPPESDEAAQANVRINREQIETLVREEGRRIRQPRERRPVVPQGAEVVREVNNRFVVEFNNNYYIERPREERFYVDARDVYYEELPREHVREVVIRPDGTRIITVRNRYGDVVRRIKVLPDDREVVLAYVDDDYYNDGGEWYDPGAELPPLDLAIPVEEYILEAEYVEDPDVYYSFLEQPPVEQVERTYSIDEVRRSARIRDKVRRIDLDIINFEFGSAQIAESEVPKLEGVAEAIQRILEENPGETFLIEGHTDAVGSDVANLALSDQRAEAVATALTNVFEIPPENLATQGYGEQYLKIATEGPERENRRVAIRRITPLVAPVASNE